MANPPSAPSIVPALKKWWDGEYVPPPPINPHDAIIIFDPGHYERHWTSRAAHAVVEFYLKEWKWVLPFLVAVVGVIVAIKKL